MDQLIQRVISPSPSQPRQKPHNGRIGPCLSCLHSWKRAFQVLAVGCLFVRGCEEGEGIKDNGNPQLGKGWLDDHQFSNSIVCTYGLLHSPRLFKASKEKLDVFSLPAKRRRLAPTPTPSFLFLRFVVITFLRCPSTSRRSLLKQHSLSDSKRTRHI